MRLYDPRIMIGGESLTSVSPFSSAEEPTPAFSVIGERVPRPASAFVQDTLFDFSHAFQSAAKSFLSVFQPRASATEQILWQLNQVKEESDLDSSPSAQIRALLNRPLDLGESTHDRLLRVIRFVGNIDPFLRPKFQGYATVAEAQAHLLGGDLDAARATLVGGNRSDPQVASMLSAVERDYSVRQAERIIQVVSAAAMIGQKRIGGFENWAAGDSRGSLMRGVQSWAREYRNQVAEGSSALVAFERMKFWIRDMDPLGPVMNEEHLWEVVGELGSIDVSRTPRPEERMNAILLHASDRVRDRHEGEAASYLYGILSEGIAYRDTARERLSHFDRDMRESEIRRFLRSLTPWTAERPEDFYGTLWTIGTMAVAGGVAGVAGRFVAAQAGSALAGQIASIATQSFIQPILSQGLNSVADGTYFGEVLHNAALMGGLGLGHAAAARIGGGIFAEMSVSVTGMTAFDLITDARNQEVGLPLLLANSVGNDLIGRASGIVQRRIETAHRAVPQILQSLSELARPVDPTRSTLERLHDFIQSPLAPPLLFSLLYSLNGEHSLNLEAMSGILFAAGNLRQSPFREIPEDFVLDNRLRRQLEMIEDTRKTWDERLEAIEELGPMLDGNENPHVTLSVLQAMENFFLTARDEDVRETFSLRHISMRLVLNLAGELHRQGMPVSRVRDLMMRFEWKSPNVTEYLVRYLNLEHAELDRSGISMDRELWQQLRASSTVLQVWRRMRFYTPHILGVSLGLFLTALSFGRSGTIDGSILPPLVLISHLYFTTFWRRQISGWNHSQWEAYDATALRRRSELHSEVMRSLDEMASDPSDQTSGTNQASQTPPIQGPRVDIRPPPLPTPPSTLENGEEQENRNEQQLPPPLKRNIDE
ncbi:MAG: hypothetical protein U1F57_11810 [bacterium]